MVVFVAALMCVGMWSAASAQSGAAQNTTPAAKPSSSANASAKTYVVILPGSKEYHWPSCALVQKPPAGTQVLFRGQATAKGFTPHKDCDLANAPEGSTAGDGTAEPVYVYVAQSDTTKYHRGDCKVFPKDAKRVLLDKDAVRGRWPCTVCRPPIRPAPRPAFQR